MESQYLFILPPGAKPVMNKGRIGILAILGGTAIISVTGFNVMDSAVTQITVDNATMSGNMTGVRLLFIQGAQSGSVSYVNATTSTLGLRDTKHQQADDPLKVLKIRFAKGEITKEQYEDMRKIIES